jgi:hypothetical protein
MSTVKAAGNGGALPAARSRSRDGGLARLRDTEAKALVSLASEAVSQAHSVVHEMHSRIYHGEPSQPVTLDGLVVDARTCLQVAEQYLVMLAGVWASGDPWAAEPAFSPGEHQ